MFEELRDMPKEQKYKDLDKVFFALAAILLIIAIAFGIAYVSCGARIRDFSGVGEAKILGRSAKTRYVRSESEDHTEYTFDVMISAGYTAFIAQQKLSRSHGWKEGDVIPIVYNVKNPREFVMGTTPEEYAKSSRIYSIIGFVCLIGGALLFRAGLRVKMLLSKIAEEKQLHSDAGEKRKSRHRALHIIAGTLLVCAFAFSPCVLRLVQGNFTGVGQAEILEVTKSKPLGRTPGRVAFRFDVRVTAGEDTFEARQTLSDKSEWVKGDVIPVVYNVKNPRQFVMGKTPEKYAEELTIYSYISMISLLGAVCCFALGRRG